MSQEIMSLEGWIGYSAERASLLAIGQTLVELSDDIKPCSLEGFTWAIEALLWNERQNTA